jgi:hypothetical protein
MGYVAKDSGHFMEKEQHQLFQVGIFYLRF